MLEKGTVFHKKALKEIVEYSNHLSNYLVDAGVIDKARAKEFQKVNESYIPFYRVFEDDTGAKSAGQGMTVYNPIKKILGSDRALVDPIESIIKNTYVYIELAERNRVLKAAVELSETHGLEELVVPKAPTMKPIEVTSGEIAKLSDSFGLDPTIVEQSLTVFRPIKEALAPDEIAVYREGKRKVYTVPPELAEALKGMDKSSASVLMKVLAGPVKTLKAGTVILPEFMIKNFTRDQVSAAIFSENGYIPVLDFARGMKEVVGGGEAYEAWLKGGGFGSAFTSIDRSYINEHVMNLDPVKDVMGKVRNLIKTPKQLAQVTGELIENATRLGEMKKALAKNGTSAAGIMESSYGTREVTLDFQRIGVAMQGINQAWAFSNPHVQGLDRIRRSFQENPTGFLIRTAAAVTVPSIMFWMLNHGDEREKEVPRWQKDLHWGFWTNDWKPTTAKIAGMAGPAFSKQDENGKYWLNEGVRYRIPKPQVLGQLFGSVAERLLDLWVAKDPKALKGLEQTIFDSVSPPITPNIAIPFVEQYSNKSLFTDSPIVPGQLEGTLPEVQYTEYTTQLSRTLGKMIQAVPNLGDKGIGDLKFSSPMVIENYIRAWSGGLGMYALRSADAGLRAAGILPDPPKAMGSLADDPFVKAFVVRFPAASAQSIVDFQEKNREHQQYLKSVQVEMGRGNVQAAIQLRLAEANRAKFVSLQRIGQSLDTLKRNIELVSKNPTIPDTEKRQLIDGMYFGMINVARTGNKLIDQIETALERKK